MEGNKKARGQRKEGLIFWCRGSPEAAAGGGHPRLIFHPHPSAVSQESTQPRMHGAASSPEQGSARGRRR